jgi:NAD(P)-dependent dehydrogenase (short-subunit alcohol dehydrogenase family)
MQDGVAVITGASRGIGAAAVSAFAAAGWRVAALARDGVALDRLAAGTGALALPCDVARWDAVAAARDAVLARFGRIDVWINNAGRIEPIADLAETDPADWAAGIATNLTGTFHGLRAAIPPMRAAGRGTIINVSSGAATTPLQGWSAYCAAKAGAAMLTRAADLEERANGLRILGLSPGAVATDMQRIIAASGINPVARIPWEDHIPPDWPAKALLWMCGPGADAFLGQDIRLRDPGIRAAVGLPA